MQICDFQRTLNAALFGAQWALLGPQWPPWTLGGLPWVLNCPLGSGPTENKNTIAEMRIGLLEKIVPLFCFEQPYLDC